MSEDIIEYNLSNLPIMLHGISRRDYFAAMAMQGRLSKGNYNYFKDVARQAVIMADDLIAELDKQTKEEKEGK